MPKTLCFATIAIASPSLPQPMRRAASKAPRLVELPVISPGTTVFLAPLQVAQ